MKTIAIIGAGPVGCYAGYLFARAGYNVTIYEEHTTIGLPIQCTGLLTADFDEFNLPKTDFLVNTFSSLYVHSPKNVAIKLYQKEYVVCRTRFDQFFAKMAQQAGATIFTQHSFLRKEGTTIIIKNNITNTELSIQPDIVIGADGPLSKTAKAYGMYHPQRQQYVGLQATVEGTFDPQTYHTYFGTYVCPGLFAWVVPESSTRARVGLATTRNTRHYFEQFLQYNGYQPLEIQAGTIPLYHPKQLVHKDNCYLLGDACGFVKATTLGGLNPGLKQAQLLFESLHHYKNYLKALAPLRRRLLLHLKIHNIMNRFTDADWEKLIQLVGQKKISSILESHTRENPIPIVIQSIGKEPRLLQFIKYLF